MSVALRAYRKISQQWSLTAEEAASLLGAEDNRIMRVSAILGIYKSLELYFSEPLSRAWFTRPNTGPLFEGSRPIDTAIEGGLPQLIAIRRYVEGMLGPVIVLPDDDICVIDPEIRGGTPVIRGSRIGIFEVAAMAQHDTVDAVVEAYPWLTAEQVERACAYAARHPELAPKPREPKDIPGARVTTYSLSELEGRIKLPDDEWEPVESVEEFTKDARDYLNKIEWAGIVTNVPGLRGGRPVIRGMRITVGDILGWLASGMSEAEILENFPELTQADIRAALAFAAEHEQVADAEEFTKGAREYLEKLDED